MFCRTKDNLALGTVLTLQLACATVSFAAECAVRHSNEQGMGIEFTGLTPENRRTLENLLVQLQA